MSRLLNKLFWKRKDSVRILIASIGTGIGIFILIISTQFASEINRVFDQSRAKGESLYLVVSKRVNLISNTLGSKNASFSEKEIKKIRKEKFTIDAAPVESNAFPVSAVINIQNFPLYTELFFESVPDRFLDLQLDDWKWKEYSPYVPIIISRDFLALYNFGFAPSQGQPQITEGALNLINIELFIGPPGNKKQMTAKIVGLSDRYSSFLVPQAFMEWANSKYGYRKEDPSRVIIKADPKTEKQISEYLKKNMMQTNKDRLKIGALGSALFTGSIIISVFGIAIFFMAIMLLIVTIQAAIAQNKEKLILLIQIGYNRKQIIRSIITGIMTIVGTSLTFFNCAGLILNTILMKLISNYVHNISTKPAAVAIILAVSSIAVIPCFIIFLIFREMKKNEK